MSEYDKCIDMLCMTGKLPLTLYDALCNEASRQITSSLADSDETPKAFRNRIIFRNYEEEYADNFSMD